MAMYAVTGTASGIGAATAARLKSQGHTVVGVDVRDADILADLSTAGGRSKAIDGILARCDGKLAGLVTAAGVGPQFPDKIAIPAINFFGTTALVVGLRAAVAAATGSIVLVSSNSAMLGAYDEDFLASLLADDEALAGQKAANAEPMALYGGSKLALLRWMRRQCAELARAGVRINAVCPGFTHTGITAAGLQDPNFRDGIQRFLATIPMGRGSEPAEQAGAIAYLLGPDASYVTGSVLFVDGGYDALLRGDRI